MKVIRLPLLALGAALLATGAAQATTVTGTGTFADNGPAGNGLNFTGATNNADITNLNLTVGTPVTETDFLTISSTDSAMTFFGTTDETDNIAEDFSFTLPSSGSGSLSGSGSEQVGYFLGSIDSVSGNITWSNPLDISFADGGELQISLSDASFSADGRHPSANQSVDVNATFTLISDPTPVPEPGTLALLAGGLLGLGIVRRRFQSL